MLALPSRFDKKKLLTPSPPPPLGDWQKCDPTLTTIWYVPCRTKTSEHFSCERKMFEYKYISILNVCELKQENANNRCSIFTFYSWSWIWKYKLCDFVSPSPATPTPRPYPDYSKLPDFHYLPSTKTPTSGRKPEPRAQIEQIFKGVSLKQGMKRQSKFFSEKYIFFK